MDPNNINQILDDEIKKEGGFVNDSDDKGGRTEFGVAEASNPEAWADGKVTEEEARALFLKKYVEGPGFDKISDPKLFHQLVDFSINSGPAVAIKRLQAAVGSEQDGILGPETISKITDATNNKLVAERVKMLCAICVKVPSQLKFLNGWIHRALEFLL